MSEKLSTCAHPCLECTYVTYILHLHYIHTVLTIHTYCTYITYILYLHYIHTANPKDMPVVILKHVCCNFECNIAVPRVKTVL
jgi:hypothetical protein